MKSNDKNKRISISSKFQLKKYVQPSSTAKKPGPLFHKTKYEGTSPAVEHTLTSLIKAMQFCFLIH